MQEGPWSGEGSIQGEGEVEVDGRGLWGADAMGFDDQDQGKTRTVSGLGAGKEGLLVELKS